MIKVFCALLIISFVFASSDKISKAYAIIYAATAAAIVALQLLA